MQTYSISQLARAFGLSRSTLLYYDRIGLLCAPERSPAGYRRYSHEEYSKLERIMMFRKAGMPLDDIRKILSSKAAPSAQILENHLQELENQILHLRNQQHAIIAMLKNMESSPLPPMVDKEMWVKMLEAAGMDEAAMATWHGEFEARAPQAHHEFLLSLGIPEDEAHRIRAWSKCTES